jgi:PAS domain-containing protein
MFDDFNYMTNAHDWWLAAAVAFASGLICLAVVIFCQTLMRRQTRVLNAAVNNMAQGLVMFDKNQRVVTFNQQYFEIYRLSPGAIKVGSTLRDLLKARAAAGTPVEDPQQYIDKLIKSMAGGKIVSRNVDLPDVRAILVVNSPPARRRLGGDP